MTSKRTDSPYRGLRFFALLSVLGLAMFMVARLFFQPVVAVNPNLCNNVTQTEYCDTPRHMSVNDFLWFGLGFLIMTGGVCFFLFCGIFAIATIPGTVMELRKRRRGKRNG